MFCSAFRFYALPHDAKNTTKKNVKICIITAQFSTVDALCMYTMHTKKHKQQLWKERMKKKKREVNKTRDVKEWRKKPRVDFKVCWFSWCTLWWIFAVFLWFLIASSHVATDSHEMLVLSFLMSVDLVTIFQRKRISMRH